MKINIVTVGQPKLAYARQGWEEYWKRLSHYHDVKAVHIADKNNDTEHILDATDNTHRVGLVIKGQQMTSSGLSDFLVKRALEGKAVSFIVGGPDGLPDAVLSELDYQWSLSQLTLPHDLAMVVLLETLYRSSTISAGQPYHR